MPVPCTPEGSGTSPDCGARYGHPQFRRPAIRASRTQVTSTFTALRQHLPGALVLGAGAHAAESSGQEDNPHPHLMRSRPLMSKARHARPRRSPRRVVRPLSIAGLGAAITAAGAGGAFAADYKV